MTEPATDTDTNTAEVAVETGFFLPGTTYIQNRPFAAPETLQIFQCVAVAPFPGEGEIAGDMIAFGFGTDAGPGDMWQVFLCRSTAWTEDGGWIEYEEANQ